MGNKDNKDSSESGLNFGRFLFPVIKDSFGKYNKNTLTQTQLHIEGRYGITEQFFILDIGKIYS